MQRTHGTVENCERIDSFEAMRCTDDCDAGISAGDLWLDCDHYVLQRGEVEKEFVLLTYPGSRWKQELRLVRIDSGFGGTRAYWLCPECWGRFRYLYFNRRFLCRKCAGLNYKCQQETQNSQSDLRKGMKIAEERLGYISLRPVSRMVFLGLFPAKPKGMHWKTYARHLERFRKYQNQCGEKDTHQLLKGLKSLVGFGWLINGIADCMTGGPHGLEDDGH